MTDAARFDRGRPRRVVFVVNEDWMFWSHRLALARAARAAGAEVIVATRVDRHGERIAREGFRVVALPWRRGARNPLTEIRSVLELMQLYRAVRPDLVHHVGIKAALYGGVAARLSGDPPQIHTIAGFGFVSISPSRRARAMRRVMRVLFRRVLSRPRSYLVVQNPDDEADVRAAGLFDPSHIRLVKGSGVDTRHFTPVPETGPVTAVLASRLIRPKGVVELVDAARLLRQRNVDVRVDLVGDPDPENPETVTAADLRGWHEEGVIHWTPRVDDMAPVWQASSMAVLPSYREGMPRALLEAAACGRPLVATDVPGCRDLVRNGDNGLLVPVRDAHALADAIAMLARDSDARNRMGARARELVEAFYSDDIVVAQMLALYRLAIDGGGRT
jgi:glycosyltransferase involved in cell wall biosynthesis